MGVTGAGLGGQVVVRPESGDPSFGCVSAIVVRLERQGWEKVNQIHLFFSERKPGC
jgi:hypothetical protein